VANKVPSGKNKSPNWQIKALSGKKVTKNIF
jgi:hypothetical protein